MGLIASLPAINRNDPSDEPSPLKLPYTFFIILSSCRPTYNACNLKWYPPCAS